ncbi:MAG: winged helix-turn-helix domain-containing protein [Gemmataceae bacterium]|nr:winged helix-turn-helix domain-containing protein [Gemmataceae bacterium]
MAKNAATKTPKTGAKKGDAARTEKARKAALAEVQARIDAPTDEPLHEGTAVRGDSKAVRVAVPRDDVAPGGDPASGTSDAPAADAPAADAAPQAPTSGEPGKKPKEPKAAKPAKKSKLQRLSALDAAAQVLAATPKPMSAKDLIAEMAARNLWASPGGKTPEATLYAAIIREVSAKGSDARFRKVERGLFQAAGK